MSWRTSSLAVKARNAGRAIGLNRWLGSCLRKGYETEYDRRMSSLIRSGDCIWDVGANVGYYTCLYSKRVADSGKVVAFEPSPANFNRLAERCAGMGNVTLVRCALGRTDGNQHFRQGEDELGATSRITGNGTGCTLVEVRSADSLLAEGTVTAPNIVKMDVEGFEWEVLEGMSLLLKRSCLRAVGIEVHFGILEERGMGHAPRQIEKLLDASGFVLSWPDSSHVIGVRNG